MISRIDENNGEQDTDYRGKMESKYKITFNELVNFICEIFIRYELIGKQIHFFACPFVQNGDDFFGLKVINNGEIFAGIILGAEGDFLHFLEFFKGLVKSIEAFIATLENLVEHNAVGGKSPFGLGRNSRVVPGKGAWFRIFTSVTEADAHTAVLILGGNNGKEK